MISPEKAIEELAFQKLPEDEHQQDPPSSPLQPRASPPASAPPPPPSPSRDDFMDPLIPPSYQHDSVGSGDGSGRALIPPKIQSEDPGTPLRASWMGNARLLPNVGLTNSYDYFCVTIHESIQQLRLGISMISFLTFFLLFWTWWWRLFQVSKWSKMVISLYLGLLAALLLFSEIAVLMEWDGQNNKHLRTLQINFGFLYHPLGKPLLLLFMASLCWGLGGLWECLLGILYFIAFVAVALLGLEPEFRRNYYPTLPDYWNEDGSNQQQQSLPSQPWTFTSWSDFSSSVMHGTKTERDSLIGNSHQFGS